MKLNSGSLRYFCCIKNGTTPASARSEYWDGNIKWVTPEDLGKLMSDKIINTKRLITEKAIEECNLPILPEGSVIISTRAPIGHMAINESPMSFNQGCRGIIPGHQIHGPFLYYMLKSRVRELNAMANGTTFVELSRDELAAVSVEFPPLDTQRRIAQFLNEKTARIDTLIEKKRELLDRLAEKRQALITRAVTKGLNLDVPMKSSGIDWLGDIPAHWEITPLRWYLRTASGEGLRNVNIEAERTETDYVPVIGGNGTMGFTDAANSEKAILVIGRVGAYCGNVHPIDEPSWVTDNALRVYDVRGFDRDYLLFALRTRDLNTLASRNAQPLMTGEVVKAQYLPYPPTSEQQAICKELNQFLGELEGNTARVDQSIQLLFEYRSALITTAVTGRITELR